MTITLGAYRALPTCKRCNVPVVPYYDLTPEHQRLGVRALGSDTSGICAPCWTASKAAGVDPDYIPARERTPFGQFQMRPSHLTTSKPGATKFHRVELPPVPAPAPAPLPEREHDVHDDDDTPTLAPFIDADWVDQGLCAQTDPETFFPEVGESTKWAKIVCAACPVQQQCLEWALDTNELYGVWGGSSPTERRALRRARGQGTAA